MKIGPRERVLLIVLGVVAVLAIVFLLFFSGGGDEPQTQGPTIRPGGRTPTPTTTPAPTQAPPETFDPGEARDPFRSPIQGSGGGGTPAPTGSPTPGATGGPADRTKVVLLDVFMRDGVRFASVEVGGEIHHVKEGDTFAGNYRVVNITERCATFAFGDERFTLCIGDEVFK